MPRTERGGIGMRFKPGGMALTVFGWTPGLRHIVTGRILACGCLAGVYKNWNGQLVEILDCSNDDCRTTCHDVNRVLSVGWTPDGRAG